MQRERAEPAGRIGVRSRSASGPTPPAGASHLSRGPRAEPPPIRHGPRLHSPRPLQDKPQRTQMAAEGQIPRTVGVLGRLARPSAGRGSIFGGCHVFLCLFLCHEPRGRRASSDPVRYPAGMNDDSGFTMRPINSPEELQALMAQFAAAAESGDALASGGSGLSGGAAAGCPTCDLGFEPEAPDAEPEPHDRHTDPMRPPSVPTDVSCLHCRKVVSTAIMRWVPESAASRIRRLEREAAEAGLVCSTCGWTPPPPHPGDEHGRWLCGTPGCDGGLRLRPPPHRGRIRRPRRPRPRRVGTFRRRGGPPQKTDLLTGKRRGKGGATSRRTSRRSKCAADRHRSPAFWPAFRGTGLFSVT